MANSRPLGKNSRIVTSSLTLWAKFMSFLQSFWFCVYVANEGGICDISILHTHAQPIITVTSLVHIKTAPKKLTYLFRVFILHLGKQMHQSAVPSRAQHKTIALLINLFRVFILHLGLPPYIRSEALFVPVDLDQLVLRT
jgi:hypothetical protein